MAETPPAPIVRVRDLSAVSASASADVEAFLAEVQTVALRLKQASGTEDATGGMALAARRVLELIRSDGPQTVPQLARSRGTSRQNIQVIVNRLEQVGWVQTVPNLAHKRSALISITTEGKTILHRSPDPQSRLADLLAARVTVPELAAGINVLNQLREVLRETKNTGTASRRTHLPRVLLKEIHSQATTARPAWGENENELPVSLL